MRHKLLLTVKKFIDKRLAKVAAFAIIFNLTACSGPFSVIDPAGPHAQDIAWIWWGMFWFSVFIIILMSMLWWRGMSRDGTATAQADVQKKQNSWVLLGGIALPTGAITLLLAFGIPAGHRMLPFDGDDVVHIEVTAYQWFWEFYYPDTGLSLIDEVHFPVDRPIHFHVSSEDVIHSFWIPRLGGKLDAIPGRVNVLRLEASQTGRFDGQCVEYCGVGHAYMDFVVEVHDADSYRNWQEEALTARRVFNQGPVQSEEPLSEPQQNLQPQPANEERP